MDNTHLLYDFPSAGIAAGLFLGIMLFNELGFRLGRYVQGSTDEDVKSMTGSIQASVLGLLALLLGFTFSMSMQRFDDRSKALIEEANAIGTTQLRLELLPESHQADVRQLLQQYLQARIELSHIDLTRLEDRQAYEQSTSQLQQALWKVAVDAAQTDPRPVTSGAFINALNSMIDSQGKRSAVLQLQVPEVVLLLLFTVFVSSGAILGYSSGLGGARVVAPTMMVSLLIVLIVFIIIDLDRPKRGVIQVNQAPLQSLVSMVRENQ